MDLKSIEIPQASICIFILCDFHLWAASVAECEGDMGGILDSVMCSREEDEERFRTIIDQAIKAKKVKTYKVKSCNQR